MKKISKILLTLSAVFAICSCETYNVDDPDTTAIAPLDGRWVSLAYDYDDYTANGSNATALEWFDVRITNTIDNASDEMWINVCNYLVYYPCTECVSFKVPCSPKNLTFSASGVSNVQAPNQIFNYAYGGTYYSVDYRYGFQSHVVSAEGSVTLDGFTTASNHKDDLLKMTYTVDGKKYMVIGNRYTGWEDDYGYITEFINNY